MGQVLPQITFVHTTLFILKHLAAIWLLGLSSYVLGRRVTRKVQYVSLLEEIGISTSLGLAITSYLVFLIGAARVLYPSVILLALLTLHLLCYSEWVASWRRVTSTIKKLKYSTSLLTGVLLSVAALTPAFLLSLFPPTAFDAIMYHLPYAKAYVTDHRLVLTPYLHIPVTPQTNEMLFTLMLLLGDDIGAQLVQFLMMILTAVILYAWGTRVFSFPVALWATALWLSTPLVIILGSSAYIDVGLTLFVTLSAFAIFNWMENKERSWLILAAIFSGLGAGSKYSALIFLVGYFVLTLMVSIRDRRASNVVIFTTIAGSIAAPWYLRNLAYTGNPIFPFLPSVFGYSLWSPEDLHAQLSEWTSSGIRGRSFFFYYDLLMLALPVLVLLPVVIHRGIKRPYVRALFILVLAYVCFWLFTASIPRYLLPVWPVLCLATAASCELFIARMSPLRRLVEGTRAAAVVALLIIFPCWLFFTAKTYRRWPLPVNQRQRDEYLSKELVSYAAYKYLNDQRGDHYTLYALYDANMAYYSNGKFLGDWFGPARYKDVLNNMYSGESLFMKLRGLGAGYFLVRQSAGTQVNLPRDEYFEGHFKTVFASPSVTLFELSDVPLQTPHDH